ncbi:MAG: 50S ribosomal protein L23 [Pseudomonadales bacterium]|nr:50S ribosomal protein L23 [Pseudomonadales bacterium]
MSTEARSYQIILAPHISEKATIVADENNQFVFKVAGDATKPEIKKAIELLFSVKVKTVQTVNVKGKQKKFGRTIGRRSSWKKAYVGLQTGHDIDFAGIE